MVLNGGGFLKTDDVGIEGSKFLFEKVGAIGVGQEIWLDVWEAEGGGETIAQYLYVWLCGYRVCNRNDDQGSGGDVKIWKQKVFVLVRQYNSFEDIDIVWPRE